MHQILIIVHQATSTPGLIGHLLEQKHYQLDCRCPAIGDRLPDRLDDHAGVVVFGGPMSANDNETLPFIQTELDWIRDVALKSDRPYLGICLGAQLVARVLGAAVSGRADERREIGYVPIQFTPPGQDEFGRSSMYVFQWHGEGFDIPAGAVRLASGTVFPNQAFQYGDRIYGLQFHPEITRDMIELWTTKASEQLVLPGAHPRDRQLHDHDQYSEAIAQWLHQFLDSWLESGRYSSAA
jgi:GMP synthase (glutamine-hydrolysing)